MLAQLFAFSVSHFTGLFFSKVVTLYVFIELAKFVGPDTFGYISLIFIFQQVVTVFFDFGLNQWYQVKSQQNSTIKWSRVFLMRVFYFCISALVCLLLGSLFSSLSILANPWFILTLLFDGLLSIMDSYWLVSNKQWLIGMKQAFRMSIVLLLALQIPGVDFLQAIFLASFGTFLVSFNWKELESIVANRYFLLDFKEMYKMAKEGFHYAVLILVSFVYARGDSFVITALLGNQALGWYGAAYRFLEGLAMLPTVLSQNLFTLAAQSGRVTMQHLKLIVLALTLMGSLVAMALVVMSPWLISVTVGNAYQPSIMILQVFGFVAWLFFINAPIGAVVQSSKLVSQFIPWGVANTFLNVVLNFFLITQYGIIGAAWAMLLSEVTGLIINVLFARKVYQLDVVPSVLSLKN